MNIIFLIIGVLLGFTAGYLILKYKSESSTTKLEERINYQNTELEQKETELKKEREEVRQLSNELSTFKERYNNLEEKLTVQKSEIEELQNKFTKEFENLANKIFDEKSTKFTAQNKDNLDQILKPLNEKIKEFKEKIEDVYDKETRDRISLSEQLKMLFELNQKMTKEATNLTNALKGENKTQGNWGEFVLENLLENSGLVKDREYFVQKSIKTEDGRRLQPDIIVKLPENRRIIIDSKVTLVAYEKYNSTEDKKEKENTLKEHILSIKNHYKDLSSKNYHNLYSVDSLDFVFMFLPIEPAWILAFQNDHGLFNEALERKIAIVSPTMLLINLKMIASIWRRENQNKNALEIARQSGALYDKFQGLLKDLQNVGDKLLATQKSYDAAINKLHTGKPNLISSVEKIKKLGAKTTKTLPSSFDNLIEEDITEE